MKKIGNYYLMSSVWAGKYAKTYHGATTSKIFAIYCKLIWSIKEFFRVIELNKYHYGNIFAIGNRITDIYGRK